MFDVPHGALLERIIFLSLGLINILAALRPETVACFHENSRSYVH
jgi:hypothetical protein